MKKMRLRFPMEKTFSGGFAEYILDCKARNLRREQPTIIEDLSVIFSELRLPL